MVAPTWNATDGWIFNGIDQYIETGNITITENMTVVIKITNLIPGNTEIIDSGLSGQPEYDLYQYLDTPNGIAIDVNDAWTNGISMVAYGILAVTKDGLYLNGMLAEPMGSAPTPYSALSPFVIGKSSFNIAPKYSEMNVQAFVVFSTTLNASEIATITAAMATLGSKWWLSVSGKTPIIAYAPQGAASYAASLVNLAALTDIEATIQRMADIANAEKATTGIAIAYPDNPASLTTLPSVNYFVGQQIYEPYRDSEDVKLEKTTIFVRVYVDHVAQGIPGEVESRVKHIIPLFRDSLLSHPTLEGLDYILRAVVETSSGIRMLMYAGENFAGCEWKMTIERIVEVNYATNE